MGCGASASPAQVRLEEAETKCNALKAKGDGVGKEGLDEVKALSKELSEVFEEFVKTSSMDALNSIGVLSGILLDNLMSRLKVDLMKLDDSDDIIEQIMTVGKTLDGVRSSPATKKLEKELEPLKQQAAAEARRASAPLADGWREAIAPGGRVYYYNEARETTWVKPVVEEDTGIQSAPARSNLEDSAPVASARPASPNQVSGAAGPDADAAPKKIARPKASEIICSCVMVLLRIQGKTEDQLFDALAGGREHVSWPDFQSLFAQLDPSLTVSQLEELWSGFDKNQDSNVSRLEFKRALCALSADGADISAAAQAYQQQRSADGTDRQSSSTGGW